MDASHENRSPMENGLSARFKVSLTVGLLVFFAVDNYHMWVERDNFPFCSHGLFNTLFKADSQLLRMVVHDDQGHSVTVDSGRVIPIEWYRAVGLAENVLVTESDQQRKDAFARLLLERLNGDPWHAFDETYASIRPAPGARFIGLEVVYQSFDLARFRYGESLRPYNLEQVYSYWLPEAR